MVDIESDDEERDLLSFNFEGGGETTLEGTDLSLYMPGTVKTPGFGDVPSLE